MLTCTPIYFISSSSTQECCHSISKCIQSFNYLAENVKLSMFSLTEHIEIQLSVGGEFTQTMFHHSASSPSQLQPLFATLSLMELTDF